MNFILLRTLFKHGVIKIYQVCYNHWTIPHQLISLSVNSSLDLFSLTISLASSHHQYFLTHKALLITQLFYHLQLLIPSNLSHPLTSFINPTFFDIPLIFSAKPFISSKRQPIPHHLITSIYRLLSNHQTYHHIYLSYHLPSPTKLTFFNILLPPSA